MYKGCVKILLLYTCWIVYDKCSFKSISVFQGHAFLKIIKVVIHFVTHSAFQTGFIIDHNLEWSTKPNISMSNHFFQRLSRLGNLPSIFLFLITRFTHALDQRTSYALQQISISSISNAQFYHLTFIFLGLF